MNVNLFLKTLAGLPLPALHKLGNGVGWLMFRLPTKQRRRARQNIELCLPEVQEADRTRLVEETLKETAKSFFEVAALWNWPGKRVLGLVTEVSGQECVDKALERGKGVVIVMPHLGSWELTTIFCSSLGPMTTLYKPPQQSQLEPMMLGGRQSLGARFVPTDASGVRAVSKALARREIVGILPDQFPKPGSGIFVTFFEQPAYTMTLIGRLIKKTDARVVYAYAERLPQGRGFRMHLREEPKEWGGGELKQITQAINTGIEQCVRQVPQQYQWTYNRFRPNVIDVAEEFPPIGTQ